MAPFLRRTGPGTRIVLFDHATLFTSDHEISYSEVFRVRAGGFLALRVWVDWKQGYSTQYPLSSPLARSEFHAMIISEIEHANNPPMTHKF